MTANAIQPTQPQERLFPPGGSEDEDIADVPEMTFGEFFDKISSIEVSDLVDVVNPLQHIPVISTIYRALTDDKIVTGARLAGGALYGGPVGVAAAGITEMIEEGTGINIAEQVASLFRGDDAVKETPAAAPTEAIAATARTTPVQLASLRPPEHKPAPEEIAPAAGPKTPPPAPANVASLTQPPAQDAESIRIRKLVAEQEKAQTQLLMSTIAKQEKAEPATLAPAPENKPAPAPARKPVPIAAAIPSGAPLVAADTSSHPWVLPPTASPQLIGRAMEQALAKYQKVLDTRRN